MQLEYPGGPKIDALSKIGKDTYNLPTPLDDTSYNFSFSGIKSAVINLVHNEEQRGNKIRKEDLACSFQNRVVNILTKKTRNDLKEYHVDNLIIAGGVAANGFLRKSIKEMCEKENINLNVPALSYCTDNATMIAAAGYYAYQKGRRADLTLNAKANDILK